MTRHPIPDAALDDRLGFTGMTGSGKTFGAGTCVERILAKRGRVVIPDPLGVWWGLRMMADGKTPSTYDIAIFGGPHGDLPLTPNAGALIGETVAQMRESAVLDLSQFDTAAAERRFMLAFLDAFYRKATGEPVHLIFDEADMWAPERIMDKTGDATKLHGIMQTVVRRGRAKGLTSWMITQRPAALSKSVLSQIDGLIAFRLTASQDRKALGLWIEGQADKEQGKAILARLPEKTQGQAVVWLPARQILDDVTFPLKETYDSSRAPKRGEKQRTVCLSALDLDALHAKLATVEAEVKASDPRLLRVDLAKANKRIAELERAKPAAVNPNAIKEARQASYMEGYSEAINDVAALHRTLLEGIDKVGRDAAALDEKLKRSPKAIIRIPPPPPLAKPAPRQIPKAPNVPPAHSGDGQDRPLGAERKPLAALASVHPSGMTEAQWAVAAGLKKKGGTWTAYKSRLISAGRVAREGGLFFATEAGLADLGEAVIPLPAPGSERVDFWASKISGIGPMIRHLAAVYPDWLSRDELAADLNLTAGAGTFSTYLSRLRSPGLIEEDAEKRVRAAVELMEGA